MPWEELSLSAIIEKKEFLLNGDQGKGKLPKAGKVSEWAISLPGHMYVIIGGFIFFCLVRSLFYAPTESFHDFSE